MKTWTPSGAMTLPEREPKEPKAELSIISQWVFRLYTRDAMLILKALGGRLTAEEAEEAKVLGDRLTALRVKDVETSMGTVSRLREHLEAATGRSVEEIIKGASLRNGT